MEKMDFRVRLASGRLKGAPMLESLMVPFLSCPFPSSGSRAATLKVARHGLLEVSRPFWEWCARTGTDALFRRFPAHSGL